MISLEEGWSIISFFIDGAIALIIAYGIWLIFKVMNDHNKKG